MTENVPANGDPIPSDPIALYETYAAKHGLTVPQLRVLETVLLRPGCTQKALCGQLQASKQRVNLLVKELAQKEMLRLAPNEKDGRSSLLCLTERGRAVAEGFSSAPYRAAEISVPPGTHTHVREDGTVFIHSHGEGHGHTHSHQHTKAVLDRLARSIGHLEKVRQMVEAGEDCSEVLIQLSAVKAAINSTGKLILKDHIEHCVVDAIEHGDRRTVEELNKAIDQFIK